LIISTTSKKNTKQMTQHNIFYLKSKTLYPRIGGVSFFLYGEGKWGPYLYEALNGEGLRNFGWGDIDDLVEIVGPNKKSNNIK
jgi:hypothetical protein